MHFAGPADKDCHEREGLEAYEVHSQGGLVGAGGARALSHELLGGHAHSTTPHLAPQYRALPPEHDAHYAHGHAHAHAQPGERASVIESSQPLIIECT